MIRLVHMVRQPLKLRLSGAIDSVVPMKVFAWCDRDNDFMNQ